MSLHNSIKLVSGSVFHALLIALSVLGLRMVFAAISIWDRCGIAHIFSSFQIIIFLKDTYVLSYALEINSSMMELQWPELLRRFNNMMLFPRMQ